MNKEFYYHLDNKHYKVVSRDSIPERESILDSIWAIKYKRKSWRIKSKNGNQELIYMVDNKNAL